MLERTAVIYTRVSTDEQAEKGYSLLDQEKRLIEFCEHQNIKVLAHFQDSHTGKTFDRPGFNELLAFCKRNKEKIEFLYTTKVDRLGRNTLKALSIVQELKAIGIQFQTIEQHIDYSSPEAFLMQVLYHTLPDIENQRRAKNIKSGMRRAQKEGRFFARLTPLGYDKIRDEKGKPIYVPGVHADKVRNAFLYVVQHETTNLAEVSKFLAKQGIALYKSTIYKILRNPFYMGKVVVRAYEDEPEEMVNGIHEGLITEELFYKVQEILDDKKRIIQKLKKIAPDQYQKGFLICKRCGRLLMSSTSRGNGGKYTYYHCTSNCGERFNAKKAEEALIGELAKIQFRPEVLNLFQLILDDNRLKNNISRKNNQAIVDKNLENIENRLLQIDTDYFINKTMPEDSYTRLKEALDKNRKALLAKKFESAEIEIIPRLPNLNQNILSNLHNHFKNATTEIKREIIGSIFSQKMVFDIDGFRTIELNSVVSLLTNKNNGFLMDGKKKSLLISDFSPNVLPAGLEPAT